MGTVYVHVWYLFAIDFLRCAVACFPAAAAAAAAAVTSAVTDADADAFAREDGAGEDDPWSGSEAPIGRGGGGGGNSGRRDFPHGKGGPSTGGASSHSGLDVAAIRERAALSREAALRRLVAVQDADGTGGGGGGGSGAAGGDPGAHELFRQVRRRMG